MTDFWALGKEYERLGKPQEALSSYSKEVDSGPNAFDALCARGALLMRYGHHQHALSDFSAALGFDPDNADLWLNKGNLEMVLGQQQEGLESLTKAVELAPTSPNALFGLGSAFHVMGRNQDAVNAYQAVLRHDPNHSAACSNLATILIAYGQHTQAKLFSQRAVDVTPRFANAVFNLALCHDALGETTEAETVYRTLLDIDPKHERAMVNLGTLLGRMERHKEAFGFFQKAMEIKPDWALPRVNAALTLREMGQESFANDLVVKVVKEEPSNLLAAVVHTVAALPAVVGDESERDVSRELFQERLSAIRTSLKTATPAEVETAIGAIQPYYLAYRSEDNRALLANYGEVIVDAMAPFQPVVPAESKRKSERLTVGIVTAHARKHSVWDAITKGIVKGLNRSKIKLVLFSLDHRDRQPPELQPDKGDRFVSGLVGLQQWVNAIFEVEPDVLIYPEVGMNQRVLQLAALRLAPKQYAMWGHPETTGLSTIDGYFSGTAFEPMHADQYYTEQLIRLPGTGSFYEPVVKITNDQANNQQKKISRSKIVCPSAAFKFQPEYDHVFIDIARRNPTAEIVFFHMTKRWISDRFQVRLTAAFSEAGLSFQDHVTFMDWMSQTDFHRFLIESDVVIDTIGFSGYNTAIQTLEVGTPFVAFEGRFMRGRLASGVLREIGLDELVANDEEDFVTKVSEFVNNKDLQMEFRAKIKEGIGHLFEKSDVIAALEAELLHPTIKPMVSDIP